MLGEFLKKQTIDIALLQEVTQPQVGHIHGYTTHMNIGTEARGTAIVMEGISATHLPRLPSGRGMAGLINGTHIVNIYVPSGTERKQERESFYTNELPWLLPTTKCALILAGDFNCVLERGDATGQENRSRALDQLVRGFHLTDVWDHNAVNRGFKHYTATGASRLDRIYVSRNILTHKPGAETLAAAFTDHMAVALRLSGADPMPTHEKGTWRINTTPLQDTSFLTTLQSLWTSWQKHKKYYPSIVLWWERYIKRMIRTTFMRYGAKCKRNRTTLENFYYATIYDIICSPLPPDEKSTHQRHLKAKITRLQQQERRKILIIATAEGECMENEEPSPYHYLNAKKRNDARTVRQIQDTDGNMQTAPPKVLQIFTDHFHRKYDVIPVANTSIQEMINTIPTTTLPEAHHAMHAPISIVELKHAIKRSKPHKAAGSDGIGHDFYARTWDISKDDVLQVLNAMYIDGQITATQKRGLLVCIPKTNHPTRPDEYRPLTLLNAGFKSPHADPCRQDRAMVETHTASWPTLRHR
jgi:endonuclease/exonuclease/phosphatase family metal-dependent hydrolase